LDILGYVRIVDRKTIVSFNPDESYYAKNGYDIQDDVLVPRVQDGETNSFLTKLIIDRVKETNEKKMEMKRNYNCLMEFLTSSVANLPENDLD
jgi:hypothetical protein